MKELIMNCLSMYGIEILLTVLLIVGFLLLLYKIGRKDLVWKIALELVCKAEKEFESGTGQKKFAVVMGSLYKRLPFLVRLLFPQSELEKYIEQALEWLKEQLKNQTFALPTGTLEKTAEAITETIIPVIDSIPTDVVINQEPIQPIQTVTFDKCNTCINRYNQNCCGCDGQKNYLFNM